MFLLLWRNLAYRVHEWRAEPVDKGRLDLAHLQRIAAVLDGIPGGTDLPHALLALEDAYVCCQVALMTGVSLKRAKDLHRETITQEETRRLLKDHGVG